MSDHERSRAQRATQVLYQHEAVSIVKHDGNYSVVATQPIKSGTLLLLEHVLSGSQEFVLGAIASCKSLSDVLYPRTFAASDDKSTMANTKMSHNAFLFNGDRHVLGDAFSKFNHSCKPNCYMADADVLTHHLSRSHTVDIHVSGLWALRAIEEGEELCMTYLNGTTTMDTHDMYSTHYGFTCACDQEYLSKNSKRTDIYINMCSAYRERDKAFINAKVDAYAKTEVAFEILATHYIGKKGYFEDSDGVIIAMVPDMKAKSTMMRLKRELRYNPFN